MTKGNKGKDWDERDKRKEEYNAHLEKAEELVKIYYPLVEKYAKINDIELPPKDDDDYLNTIYSFVYDSKFVDFANDECGIIFYEDMFHIELTDEELEEFKGKS